MHRLVPEYRRVVVDVLDDDGDHRGYHVVWGGSAPQPRGGGLLGIVIENYIKMIKELASKITV